MASTLLNAEQAKVLEAGKAPVSVPATVPVRCEDHSRGLLLIGLFKLSKCALAVLSGLAAYHWATVDLGALAVNVIGRVHIIDPMGHFAQQLISRADDLDAHDMRRLGVLSFVLAALYLAEGTGLMLKKVWAEYLTVVLTAGAMPYEVYEIADHFTWMKVAVLVANAAVVLYLAILLIRNRRSQAHTR